MKRDTILKKIAQCIEKISLGKINSVTFTDRIEEDLGIDSMSTTELVFSLEENFKIDISDNELFNIKTINDLVSLVLEKKGDMVEHIELM